MSAAKEFLGTLIPGDFRPPDLSPLRVSSLSLRGKIDRIKVQIFLKPKCLSSTWICFNWAPDLGSALPSCSVSQREGEMGKGGICEWGVVKKKIGDVRSPPISNVLGKRRGAASGG